MKSIVTVARWIRWVVACVALAVTTTAMADVFEYTIENNQVTITEYNGSSADVVIPETIEGLPVTRIGQSAFFNKTFLESVEIPQSVVEIGASAFAACFKLTAMVIPDSVVTLGNSVFSGSSGLKYVTIGCNVSSIPYRTFYGCRALREINIPDSVTSIGNQAFYNCERMYRVEIGSGVASIGDLVFWNALELRSINVAPANPYYHSIGGVLFDSLASRLMVYPRWGPKETGGWYTVPDGVLAIDDYAFRRSRALYRVAIPDSVQTIGAYAFTLSEHLKEVHIGSGVTNIKGHVFGDGSRWRATAFVNCDILEKIEVSPENASYSSENGVLFDKGKTVVKRYPPRKQGTYVLPDTVTTIGGASFRSSGEWSPSAGNGFSWIGGLTMPEGVMTIERSAFEYCYWMLSAPIPSTVTRIEPYAFHYCGNLANVTLPPGLTRIEKWSFADCGKISSIKIPQGVTVIEECAFAACSSLGSVFLPEGLHAIGDGAFGRNRFSSIVLPATLNTLGEFVFSGNMHLRALCFRGNVPATYHSSLFSTTSDQLVTASDQLVATSSGIVVYYLSHAVGWGETFAGHPTQLFNPKTDIDYVTPASGSWQGGYQVTIGGANVRDPDDPSVVMDVTLAGFSVATIDSVSTNQIVVTAGSGTPGSGDVRVIAFVDTVKSNAFTYLKTDQTINFPPIGDKLTPDQVVLSATASSGLPVSFTVTNGPAVITDNKYLTFVDAGEVHIVASQPGNDNWNPAPDVTNSFTVMNGHVLNYAASMGGTLIGLTKQIVKTGEDGSPVEAVPDKGFHFVHWSDEATANPRQDVQITNDLAVTAWFARNAYTLTVTSDYGDPNPGIGVHTNFYGTRLTNSVNKYVIKDSTQYVAAGWTMSGHGPETGSNHVFVMTVTNKATLTWQWQTNYRYEITVFGGQILGTTNGWYAPGTIVSNTAIARNDTRFMGWQGVPAGMAMNNPLVFELDQAYPNILARFRSLRPGGFLLQVIGREE